jgi:CheY-like chemotaxis protein
VNRGVNIVLLVEHDPIQSVALARVLKEDGYSVIRVSRANDALEVFVSHYTDIAVVVVDTQTPMPAGPTLLGALHDIAPQVPVVAMSPPKVMATGASRTSSVARSTATAALAVGPTPDRYPNVVAALTKPVAAADLLVHVQHALQSPHLLGTSASNWPPNEEELDDIHVVDPQAVAAADAPPVWKVPPPRRSLQRQQQPQADRHGPVAFAEPYAIEPTAFLESRAEVALAPLAAAPIVPAESSMETVGTLDAAPVVRRVLDDPAVRQAVPRFVPPQRWIVVAATALVGVTLTTLLEFRNAPVRQTSADNAPARVEAAVLQARGYRLGLTELVPAPHVRSRVVAARMRTSIASDMSLGAEALRSAARSTPALNRDTVHARTPTRPAASVAASAPRPAPDVPGASAVSAVLTVAASTHASAVMMEPLPSSISTHHVEAAESAKAPVTSTSSETTDLAEAAHARADERGIYQVLRQYQNAYERLDANAARAVWPSLNTRALARAFGGLKEQSLEFSDCRVAMAPREATAICGGRATYVPRVGQRTVRTAPREWTFQLQKVDRDWHIAKAEVR